MKFKKCGSIAAGCAASSKKIQKNFEGSKPKNYDRPTLVQAVVVVFGVVGLRRVDDEQAGSPDELGNVSSRGDFRGK